jgi:hypothetical protein
VNVISSKKIMNMDAWRLSKLKVLDISKCNLSEEANVKMLNRTIALEDLRLNAANPIGEATFFKLREREQLKKLTINHWKLLSSSQDFMMRKNILTLRSHIGYYNLSHLNLYEFPIEIKDALEESGKTEML